MLNIGKLAPGGEDYYLATVATSVELYYTGGGEAPGQWLGQALEPLGLDGEVQPETLRRVLGARHPETDDPLVQHQRQVPGFDLTFRAPKSVSLLWGLADEEIAGTVRQAHDAAVGAAVDYLERHAAFTRRGKGGAEQVPVDGFVGAAFRHRTSRADDPLLHTHVLVANLAHTPDDDQWRTLDARHLYTHAKTAGYLYQAHLRHELSQHLGVAWGPVHNGYADIDGVSRELVETFSRRRSEILGELARVGHSSARAAQVATLATRRAKSTEPVDLQEQWRLRAAAVGWDPDDIAGWTGRSVTTEPSRAELRRAAEHLLGPAGLTASTSTFTRRDGLQGWCTHLRHGAPVHRVERLADHLLDGTGRTVRLSEHSPRDAVSAGIRRRDGRLVATPERRYSTPELLALEQRLVTAAAARRTPGTIVADRTVDRVLAARAWLADEQVEAVRRLTLDGAGTAVVVGRAGSGKTAMLGAARQAWDDAGIPVTGAALAARAALELRNGAGIDATTIERLLLDADRYGGLPHGGVLVIDEAGMVGTRTLARLMELAETSQTKVVLVGDHHQLPELQAGGTFAGLATRLDPIELTQNRRQHELWERDALDELRDGDLATAVEAYGQHGRVRVADTVEAVREQLVGEWWQAVDEHGLDAVMIAARRVDIDDLNARARQRIEAAGGLGRKALLAGDREFRVGDRVLCLRNHTSVGVLNGTRGTVTAIDRRDHSLTFRRDDTATEVQLPSVYLDAGWVDHGYAITAHKAQGLTCDATFVLADDATYREWGYVALSRGRHDNRLYLVETPGETDPPDDPTHPQVLQDDARGPEQRLTADLHRSHRQAMALDHLDTEDSTVVPATREFVPPSYLVNALGPRPTDPNARELWRAAAQAIETFRDEHGVDDPEQPLGRLPDAASARDDFHAALGELLAARRELMAPTTSIHEGVTPDLGLELA